MERLVSGKGHAFLAACVAHQSRAPAGLCSGQTNGNASIKIQTETLSRFRPNVLSTSSPAFHHCSHRCINPCVLLFQKRRCLRSALLRHSMHLRQKGKRRSGIRHTRYVSRRFHLGDECPGPSDKTPEALGNDSFVNLLQSKTCPELM